MRVLRSWTKPHARLTDDRAGDHQTAGGIIWGSIQIDSALGRGTKFIIHLPTPCDGEAATNQETKNV